MKKFLINTIAFSSSLLLFSCSSPSALTTQSKQVDAPSTWSATHHVIVVDSQSSVKGLDNWLITFKDPVLIELVSIALKNNKLLKSNRYNVEIARQKLTIVDATDLPELSLGVNQSRRKQVFDSGEQYQSSADINVQLNYEVDLWGKLSDQQRQASLTYKSSQAQYLTQQRQLIADVARAWFNVSQAQQLLNLFKERANNLNNNLEMIQASYRLGLNQALDVYLTQNDVSREQARIAEQQQTLQQSKRALELLLGRYPNASLIAQAKLPAVPESLSLEVPAQLMTKRPDILTSWYQLLALDAGLAVAHKQRFPRFSLTASSGDSSDQLFNLLDGSSLVWSLIGNLTVPLFNAGRLESQEEQARLAVVQKEQSYLDLVYKSFAEVENNISNQQSLKKRYGFYRDARENALVAEKLSFNQYLRGLVTYTTVLESQRRAFDAQTTLIQLKNQLLQNRISLAIALGSSPDVSIEINNNLGQPKLQSKISHAN